MEKYNDEEIIQGLKARNNDIVSYLYQRYMPMIRQIIKNKGGDASEVEDLFQDGMYGLLIKLQAPDFKLEHKFKTYFYSICLNMWSNRIRKSISEEKYLSRKLDEVEPPHFVDLLDTEMCEDIFWKEFEKLDKLCKTILKLLWRQMLLKEIAEVLGNSYSYIRRKKCECNSCLMTRVKSHPTIICYLREEDNFNDSQIIE